MIPVQSWCEFVLNVLKKLWVIWITELPIRLTLVGEPLGIVQPILFYQFKQFLTLRFVTSWISQARRNFNLGASCLQKCVTLMFIPYSKYSWPFLQLQQKPNVGTNENWLRSTISSDRLCNIAVLNIHTERGFSNVDGGRRNVASNWYNMMVFCWNVVIRCIHCKKCFVIPTPSFAWASSSFIHC